MDESTKCVSLTQEATVGFSDSFRHDHECTLTLTKWAIFKGSEGHGLVQFVGFFDSIPIGLWNCFASPTCEGDTAFLSRLLFPPPVSPERQLVLVKMHQFSTATKCIKIFRQRVPTPRYVFRQVIKIINKLKKRGSPRSLDALYSNFRKQMDEN